MNAKTSSWESAISLNSDACGPGKHLPPVANFRDMTSGGFEEINASPEAAAAMEKDTYPLPDTDQREGYYGDNHLRYWLSGFRDYRHLNSLLREHSKSLEHMFDFGGATGRVSRHFACHHPRCRVYLSDLNLRHVNWVNAYLPPTIFAFQNTSIPHLPLKESSLDLVTAFSVFTHIEVFHLQWFLELRRILKPEGLFYLTLQTEHTLANLNPGWPLAKSLQTRSGFDPEEGMRQLERDGRLIYRFNDDTSYSAHIFYHKNYFLDVIGRIFHVLRHDTQYPDYQDSMLLAPR